MRLKMWLQIGVCIIFTMLAQSGLTDTHQVVAEGPATDQLVKPQSAAALVRTTAEQVLAEMSNRKQELQASPGKIYDLVDDIVLPRFDFKQMAQLVLGKYWRTATENEKIAFISAFRELLIRTYATALLSYSGQDITYLPSRQEADATQATVNTQVSAAGAVPVPIDYKLSLSEGKWKVFDVSIDGVSLVSNYRTTFASQIRRYRLSGLIGQLEERNKRDK